MPRRRVNMYSPNDPTIGRKILPLKSGTLLAILLFCALIVASPPAATGKRTDGDSAAKAKSFPRAAGLPAHAANEDKGDFKLVYGKVKDKDLKHLEGMIKDSKLFEGILADLNNELALPVDVPVRFLECASLPDTAAT